MADDRSYDEFYTRRGCLRFFIALLVAFSAVVFLLYFWVDSTCLSSADTWLNDYPGSTLVSQEYSFVRPFGIGETVRVIYSSTTVNAVRQWYLDEDDVRARRGQSRSDGPAWMRWFADDADDGGTIVILRSECAKNWVLWSR